MRWRIQNKPTYLEIFIYLYIYESESCNLQCEQTSKFLLGILYFQPVIASYHQLILTAASGILAKHMPYLDMTFFNVLDYMYVTGQASDQFCFKMNQVRRKIYQINQSIVIATSNNYRIAMARVEISKIWFIAVWILNHLIIELRWVILEECYNWE